MEKIWLKHDPAGVPADIDPKISVDPDLFEESVASFGERPAYYCMGSEITLPISSACRRLRRVAAVAGLRKATAWR